MMPRGTQAHTTANVAHADKQMRPILANEVNVSRTEMFAAPAEGRADMKNSLRKVHRRASTSGMGTARHRLIDRGGPRGDVRQPAASQRVQDGHAGRWSSCRDSIRVVRELPEHGAAFFGRSLKVRIELEDVQPQDNFRSGGILDWSLTRSCGAIGCQLTQHEAMAQWLQGPTGPHEKAPVQKS